MQKIKKWSETKKLKKVKKQQVPDEKNSLFVSQQQL